MVDIVPVPLSVSECPSTVLVIPLVLRSLPAALVEASYVFSKAVLTGLCVTVSVIDPIE